MSEALTINYRGKFLCKSINNGTLLSLSVRNVFMSIIEDSILFIELGKNLYDKSSFLYWICMGPTCIGWVPSLLISTGFLNDVTVLQKPPSLKVRSTENTSATPLVAGHKIVQNLWFVCQMKWLQFLLVHFGLVAWTSPHFFNTYKRLAINHHQYLKQIQSYFSLNSLHNLLDYSVWVVR